ncbi:MAG TPA: hypothetical protein VJ652_04305 [Noviherbaspirillum sp.]|nr:hypothetical protein [Noviherbaspirillum sp.]
MRGAPDPLAALTHLNALIANGGEFSIGRLSPVECVATATDEDNCPAMLQRRPGESLHQLLVRLDDAIARAYDNELFTDEMNGQD